MRSSPRPLPYLAVSIVFTVGLLLYYKYAALIGETLAPLLSPAFVMSTQAREIFLPLGISFYSFQIIALNVDITKAG